MLIENDKRGNALQLLYSDEKFAVPKNVYIIGMMNTADRSLAMLDYALRRRFAFFDIKPGFETPGFREYRMALDNEKFNKLINCVENLNGVIASDESLGEGFCMPNIMSTVLRYSLINIHFIQAIRQVTRDTKHYSLQMIIAVGFKVNSERAVQFRKWVNQIAKDYTIKGWVMDEMKQLNRMVTAYLDFAENMTIRHIPLTMQDWEKRLNSFIEMFDYGILQDAGKVSAEIAKLHAETEFEKYRVIQDRLFINFENDMYKLTNDDCVTIYQESYK